ncbi:hypothetical protein [Gordonia aurantiaca]|uniref:hypothetical protein n=1 Tax=Gordonia sp. B21 TaxID=3151852 RepID=UPI00326641F3
MFEHLVKMVTFAHLPGVIWIEEQMLQRDEELVAARDDVGRTDDCRQRGLAEQFREGLAVGFVESDDLVQDRCQLPRIVTNRVAKELERQLRLLPGLRDVGNECAGNHIEHGPLCALRLVRRLALVRVHPRFLPVLNLFPTSFATARVEVGADCLPRGCP